MGGRVAHFRNLHGHIHFGLCTKGNTSTPQSIFHRQTFERDVHDATTNRSNWFFSNLSSVWILGTTISPVWITANMDIEGSTKPRVWTTNGCWCSELQTTLRLWLIQEGLNRSHPASPDSFTRLLPQCNTNPNCNSLLRGSNALSYVPIRIWAENLVGKRTKFSKWKVVGDGTYSSTDSVQLDKAAAITFQLKVWQIKIGMIQT